jgi:hypothetical protein
MADLDSFREKMNRAAAKCVNREVPNIERAPRRG